jgi:hypothetical protein
MLYHYDSTDNRTVLDSTNCTFVLFRTALTDRYFQSISNNLTYTQTIRTYSTVRTVRGTPRQTALALPFKCRRCPVPASSELRSPWACQNPSWVSRCGPCPCRSKFPRSVAYLGQGLEVTGLDWTSVLVTAIRLRSSTLLSGYARSDDSSSTARVPSIHTVRTYRDTCIQYHTVVHIHVHMCTLFLSAPPVRAHSHFLLSLPHSATVRTLRGEKRGKSNRQRENQLKSS